MTQYQQYLGRLTITSSMTAFNVVNSTHNVNCYINTGSVFLEGYAGETTENLCEKFQNAIRKQSNQAACTVDYAPATGRVTVGGLTSGVNIYFTHNALGDALGFASQWQNSTDPLSTGAFSVVGAKQPRYVWRPSRGAADMPVHVNTWWDQRSTTKLTRSIDGSVVTTEGNLLYDGTYGYRNLPSADVIRTPGETDTYRPLESFWQDVVHAGERMRVYPDRTANLSTSYMTGYWVTAADGADSMDVGPFTGQVGRSVASYDGLWDVDFALIKYV